MTPEEVHLNRGSIVAVAFPLFQSRQQEGDQPQEDFIGKGDEIRDDQVGDEEAQGECQELGIAEAGGELHETIS